MTGCRNRRRARGRLTEFCYGWLILLLAQGALAQQPAPAPSASPLSAPAVLDEGATGTVTVPAAARPQAPAPVKPRFASREAAREELRHAFALQDNDLVLLLCKEIRQQFADDNLTRFYERATRMRMVERQKAAKGHQPYRRLEVNPPATNQNVRPATAQAATGGPMPDTQPATTTAKPVQAGPSGIPGAPAPAPQAQPPQPPAQQALPLPPPPPAAPETGFINSVRQLVAQNALIAGIAGLAVLVGLALIFILRRKPKADKSAANEHNSRVFSPKAKATASSPEGSEEEPGEAEPVGGLAPLGDPTDIFDPVLEGAEDEANEGLETSQAQSDDLFASGFEDEFFTQPKAQAPAAASEEEEEEEEDDETFLQRFANVPAPPPEPTGPLELDSENESTHDLLTAEVQTEREPETQQTRAARAEDEEVTFPLFSEIDQILERVREEDQAAQTPTPAQSAPASQNEAPAYEELKAIPLLDDDTDKQQKEAPAAAQDEFDTIAPLMMEDLIELTDSDPQVAQTLTTIAPGEPALAPAAEATATIMSKELGEDTDLPALEADASFQAFHPDETVTIRLAPEAQPPQPKAETLSGSPLAATNPSPGQEQTSTTEFSDDLFDREFQQGLEDFENGNWGGSVHHLSIAAALRPEARHVKEKLREARRRRKDEYGSI